MLSNNKNIENSIQERGGENTVLYVVTHKELNNIFEERNIIGVGGQINCADTLDNTGENIAEKNSSFCELTALYWVWKNSSCKYFGIEHYRRIFLDLNGFSLMPIKKEKIENLLTKYDIVLPKKYKCIYTSYLDYELYHPYGDLDVCRKIINKICPEYIVDFDFVMNAKSLYTCNIMALRSELSNDYCNWLFSILFEAEKIIDISNRNVYQQRVFGFLAERLLNVWIRHNNLRITELYIGENKRYNVIPFFFNMIVDDAKKIIKKITKWKPNNLY